MNYIYLIDDLNKDIRKINKNRIILDNKRNILNDEIQENEKTASELYDQIHERQKEFDTHMSNLNGLSIIIEYMKNENLNNINYEVPPLFSNFVLWFIKNKCKNIFKPLIYFHDIDLDKSQIANDANRSHCGFTIDEYDGVNYRIKNRGDIKQILILSFENSVWSYITDASIGGYLYDEEERRNFELAFSSIIDILEKHNITDFSMTINRDESGSSIIFNNKVTEEIEYRMVLKI